jgi:hypothetical protein
VRLMSDYGAGSPIWVSDGVVSPSMLGVSEDLAARLYAWQDYFCQWPGRSPVRWSLNLPVRGHQNSGLVAR